jgi:hypothetical protein
MNEEYIEEHKINRSHILSQYLPDPSTDWFPPMFHLGVALTMEEADFFARRVKIPVPDGTEGVGHIYHLETFLSEVCDLSRPGVMVRICDSPKYPLVFTLASNYNLRPGRNLDTPFKRMVEIVQEVFGSSKSVMWWLDQTMNHDPENYFVSDSSSGTGARYRSREPI